MWSTLMFRTGLFESVAVVLAVVLSASVSAHGLKVFATAEGDTVHGYVYFTSGGPFQRAPIRVVGDDGRELSALTADNEGRFHYAPARDGRLHFIVETADGHRAEYSLTYAGGLASDDAPVGTQARHNVVSQSTGVTATAAGDMLTEREKDELARLVECALERHVNSLREQLQRSSERVRLHEIIGGIGYIVGVLGLFAIYKTRRHPAGG